MPHVIVHFDPTKVDQELIDKLKFALQQIVANAMSYIPRVQQDLKEICVRQQAAHPTDVNVAAIEIEIQAGNARNRLADVVVEQIIDGVIRTQLIPLTLLELEDCCVWLRFNGENSFAKFNPESVPAALPDRGRGRHQN